MHCIIIAQALRGYMHSVCCTFAFTHCALCRATCYAELTVAAASPWYVREKASGTRVCTQAVYFTCAVRGKVRWLRFHGMMATTTVGVATFVSSGKRDAAHLDTLATGMDFEDSVTMNNQQVMSPRPEGNSPGRVAQRSLTLRTRRAVHQGRHETDDQVMALDRHAASIKQKAQGYTRTIAQRTKLRMSSGDNEEMNLRRRVDLLTLELEKTPFELRTVTEQAKYMYRFATESHARHEQFQQQMRMCAYMSDERTRVFRETEKRYEGMVADLRGQVDRHKQQFREKVRETVEAEVKHKSDQIAELQERMRHSNHNEVAQLREQLAMQKAKLDQLAWREETRAQDIRVARETILSGNSRHQEMCAEVENLKTDAAPARGLDKLYQSS
eukprot:2668063-Amphidinium_carterae.2